jgi:hypothetical protein
MSTFKEQAQFIANQLIYLVEHTKFSFSAAAQELRSIFHDKKNSNHLVTNVVNDGKSLNISRFELEILAEATRMELADKLLELKVAPRLALHVVNTRASDAFYLINAMIKSKNQSYLKDLVGKFGAFELGNLNDYDLKALDYFIMRHNLSGQKALNVILDSKLDKSMDMVSAIEIQLPSILRIAADMMKQARISFATTLEQMVSALRMQTNPVEDSSMQLIQPGSWLQQIETAKLIATDFDILFPASFGSAQNVLDNYIFQTSNHTIDANAPHVIETVSLQWLEKMGWNQQEAKHIYIQLNTAQVRGLEQAAISSIPCYANTAAYLLTMMNFDEADAEIRRIVGSRFPFAKYKIAFDPDNNYAINIQDSGLQLWHIEFLLSPKTIHKIYTSKFANDNRLAILNAETEVLTRVTDKIVAEHHKNRGHFYDKVIGLARDVMGYNEDSAKNFPYQFAEAEFATLPFIVEHVVPKIIGNLAAHAMYQHNMTLDNSINMIWKIITRRFKVDANPYFYNAASGLELEDWYVNLVSDKIRLDITMKTLMTTPHITSPVSSNDQWAASHKFRTFIHGMFNELRDQRYQESINALMQAGANETAATALVKSGLPEKEAFQVPYNVQIKTPVIKHMMKALMTIDRTLLTYADAEAQMLLIMKGKYDHLGARINYEVMTDTYGLKPHHLILVSTTEREQIVAEAATSVQTYQSALNDRLIQLSEVTVNRSHYLYPRRNDTLMERPPLYVSNQTRFVEPLPLHTQYLGRMADMSPSFLNLAIGMGGAFLLVVSLLGVMAKSTPLRALGLFRCGKRKSRPANLPMPVASVDANSTPVTRTPSPFFTPAEEQERLPLLTTIKVFGHEGNAVVVKSGSRKPR